MTSIRERAMRLAFALAALASIGATALICWFIFSNAASAIREIGLWNFVTGTAWKPKQSLYGILLMIVGSCYVTAGAVALGVPLGILTAVFMAKFCPRPVYRIMKPTVTLLAGVPSVVYGFFGLVALVPLIGRMTDSSGYSILSASVLLAIMILPTVVQVSESALTAVPDSYYEGSRALGASHAWSVYRAVLPAAKSGVLAGVVLGVGRALGETMAVIMVAGNQARMPRGILAGARTLTVNIVMELGYAADLHRGALIATGAVLFVFILLVNLLLSAIKRRIS